MSINEYILKIRNLIDLLAIVGETMKAKEPIEIIYGGLPEEYEKFIMSMDTRSKHLSVAKIKALLLTQERIIKNKHQAQAESPMANLSQYTQSNWNRGHGSNYGCGSGFSPHNNSLSFRVGFYPQRGGNYQYPQRHGKFNYIPQYDSSRGYVSHANRERGSTGRGRVQCQLCGEIGHVVMQYFYRYDHQFFGPAQLQCNQSPQQIQGHLTKFGDDQF